AFDKTGTITIGKPVVTHVASTSSLSEQDIITLAASLEAQSEHPLADAVMAYNTKPLLDVHAFLSITGKGIQGTINKKQYVIGNNSTAQLTQEQKQAIQLLEEQGNSVLLLSHNKKLLGYIGVADTIKPEAKSVIAQLKNMGI